jgi:hypothetical protein
MTATPSLNPPPEAAPVCRNCGAAASGTYCTACGQETSLALPTVRALLREAAGRYVAFDGRMWRTLIGLCRPGFLTLEYFAGRRRRYIRPARLFLVFSIGLFALLRFVGGSERLLEQGLTSAREGEQQLEVATAPTGQANVRPGEKKRALDDATSGSSDISGALVEFGDAPWVSPLRERAKQFRRLPRQEQVEQIFSGVLRYGPYAMFALLPLFALLLKMVYVGRARCYPLRPRRYAAHLVFGAHNHAFLFLVVVPLVLLPRGAVRTALIIWVMVYLLLSMHAVYGGRWSGVIARAAVISLVYLVIFSLVVTGLVVAAVLLR